MDLLGASAESNTRVFVCFFLGLALGSAMIAGFMPRIHRPWRCLGWIELGVGLTSLPILLLPEWSAWVWQELGPQSLLSGVGYAVKTGLSLVLLLPPTVLMGMTLPMVVAAACSTGVSQATDAVWLYAVNTMGGAIGLAVVASLTIWHLGVPGSMLVLAGVNFLVAAGSFARSRQEGEPGKTAIASPPVRAASSSQPRWLPAILATASGGGVMAFEVLALQLFDLSVPLSFFPPAAVLFCVILLMAVAAALVPRLVSRLGDAHRLAPSALALTGLCMVFVPVGFLSLGGARTADLVYSKTFAAFLAKLAGLSLVTLGPAFLLAGTIFPLAISRGLERAVSTGRGLGVLLMLNAVGAVAAAEFVRGILLPRFGVHVAIGIVAIGYCMLAVVLQVSTDPGHLARYAIPILGLCGTTAVTMAWLPGLPLFYWGNAYQALEIRSSREGVLTVFEGAEIGRGLSFNNQYLLGGSGVAGDEQRQSHIPLLLHPAPGNVAFAGLGTGITASGALRHSAVKSITAMELSTMVADAAAKHFGAFNGRLLDQTNVTLAIEDARTYLAACHERFDVVIGDLFTPWRPGEAGLACREYFRAARGALRRGGVFCQWLPLHQLTADQFVIILETFHTVFPQAYLFRNHCKTSNIPLALIGFKDAVLDWAVVRARCDGERAAGRLADPLCRHAEGVAMLYFGSIRGPGGRAEINTLGNLRIELSAGLSLVVPRPGDCFSYAADGNPWLPFLTARRSSWSSDPTLPGDGRDLPETGLLITRLDVACSSNHPASGTLEQELRAKFPPAILSDEGADWSLWPGSIATLNTVRSWRPGSTEGVRGESPTTRSN